MKRFWKTLTYFWRAWTDKASDTIENPVRDSKYQIEDAEKECAKFEGQIARLISTNNGNSRKLVEETAEINKWKSVAERAAKNNNADDVKAALQNQLDAERRVKDLQDELRLSQTEALDLKRQLDVCHLKIERAKSNSDKFAARMEGAQLRQSMNGNINNLKNAFSSLDDLEKRANTEVDLANAYDELNSNPNQSLADKYTTVDSDLDSRVEKLMAAAKN